MKTFLKFVIALFMVFFTIMGVIYIAISIPKKVDVTWTKEDLNSYMKKTHTNILTDANTSSVPSDKNATNSTTPDALAQGRSQTTGQGVGLGSGTQGNLSTKSASGLGNLEYLLFNNFQAKGFVKVDDYLTAAEVTAMVNSVSLGTSIFNDIRIGFCDDGTVEASAYIRPAVNKISNMFPEVKKYDTLIKSLAGKPIYWRYYLTRVDNKKFEGHTQELRVGQIPIPLSQADEGLKIAGVAISNMISKLDGFSCEEFKFDKQGMHFKGSIPTGLVYK